MLVRASIGPMRLESQEDAQAALLALYELDLHYWRTRPAGTWPPLLESGVRYKREKRGRPEEWLTVPELYARGFGDCEDLAAAYAAECTAAGRPAVPRIDGAGDRLWHITVHHADGTRTDPSMLLGMGQAQRERDGGRDGDGGRKRELRNIARRVGRGVLSTSRDAALATTTGRILRGIARGGR